MHIYRTFVKQLLKYYFLSSFVSVIGVGGVLIATTLHVEQSDIPVLLRIVFLSFLIMVLIEGFTYRKDRTPILNAFKTAQPSLDQLQLAYQQTHRFPMLTGIRILGPHLLGLSLPALTLTGFAIHYGQLSFSYEYMFYALICALLIATMHAMIEYFKTSTAIEPVLLELQRMSRERYHKRLSLNGRVLISIKTKFQLSALLIGAFPLLLFSLATQVRLSQGGPMLIDQFWTWSGLVLTIGICLSIYGAWLLFSIIMRPLNRLTDAMSEVERGRFDIEADDFYSDEFSRAIHGFNHMVKGLEERETMNSKMHESFFATLAAALDARDAYTAGHSERVAHYAVQIGRRAGFSDDELLLLKKTGLLHDIGKIAVPDSILLKDGRLTEDEFDVIKQHPERGEDILKQIQPAELMASYIPGVRSHHERVDGRGYPDQLSGNEIPPMGKILAVADAFDAMISDRPYRKGMSQAKAMSILTAGKGSQWDPAYVDYFIEWLEEEEQYFISNSSNKEDVSKHERSRCIF